MLMKRFFLPFIISSFLLPVTGFAGELSPQDGDVYMVGDPVLVNPRSHSSCVGSFEGSVRTIEFVSGSTPIFPRTGTSSNESIDEIFYPMIPGTYWVTHKCSCAPQFCGENGSTFYQEEITVLSDCPVVDPRLGTLPENGAEISVFPWRPAGTLGLPRFVTLDNSVSQLFGIQINNRGTEDLVIIDVIVPMEYEAFSMFPTNINPLTVIRPGNSYVVYMDVVIIDPDKFRDSERFQQNFYILSNDFDEPSFLQSLSIDSIFESSLDVPQEYIYSGEYPENPPTPECTDINSDGTTDAADIVDILLGR